MLEKGTFKAYMGGCLGVCAAAAMYPIVDRVLSPAASASSEIANNCVEFQESLSNYESIDRPFALGRIAVENRSQTAIVSYQEPGLAPNSITLNSTDPNFSIPNSDRAISAYWSETGAALDIQGTRCNN